MAGARDRGVCARARRAQRPAARGLTQKGDRPAAGRAQGGGAAAEQQRGILTEEGGCQDGVAAGGSGRKISEHCGAAGACDSNMSMYF